jgi:RHS repeat-associated protein
MLAMSQHLAVNPQHYFYHADGNGNITALLNAQQILVAKYLYDPFGNILSKSGSLADNNPYRFSSKEYDQNAALVYYLYRYYEPSLARWQNRDPLGETGLYEVSRNLKTSKGRRVSALYLGRIEPNIYQFVHNDPMIEADFLGLFDGEVTHSDPLDSGANKPGGAWYENCHPKCPPGTTDQTLAEAKYGGSTIACIRGLITGTLSGTIGTGLSMTVYGAGGSIVGEGALAGTGAAAGTGAIIGSGGGALLGAGVAIAAASAICNYPDCY